MTDENKSETVTYGGGDYLAPLTATQHPLQTPFDATTQLSLHAAVSQLTTLKQFGSELTDAVSIENRAVETARRRREYRDIFERDGVVEIRTYGVVRDLVEYQEAVDAIQAKAMVLGYGADSLLAAITPVPGGYVGRYAGNDIYAGI